MKNFILYLFSFCVLSFLSVFFSTNEETFADESIRFFDGNTTIEFQNEEEFEQYLLEESQKIDIVDESLIDEGEMSDCFNYYTFQSIQTRIAPEKDSFVAGEEINFTGKIENENPYPIFNGYLYVRIAEKNPNYIEEGHNIIDEFFALGSIAIDTESSIPVSFTWRIPDNLKFGEYTIDYFFSVNKRMNLSGLPFTNEIIAGFSEFTVSSNEEGGVYFLKESTTVNGEKYNHIGDWPFLNSGGEAFVSQQIVNSSDEDINSTISYNLYFWDSLDAEDRISSRTEEILLQPGENKTLTYEIPQIEESVYYLQIIAENDNGTKSIVNIRITSDISKPRINYFGLDKFPIQEGDLVTLYSCFHNTSHGSLPTGKTVLTARDETGEDIASVIYEGMIPSEIFSNKKVFTAEDDLNYLVLHHELYDENEVLIEYQEIIYDMSLLKDEIEKGVSEDESNYIIYIVIIVSVLLVLFLIWFFLKGKTKNKKVTDSITSFIIFSFIFLTLFLCSTQTSKAQSTIGNFRREQGSIVSRPFSATFVRRAVIRQSNWLAETNMNILHLTPNEIYGGASYRYNISTTANGPLLAIGDVVGFNHDVRDFYYLTGATWDTPHFGQKITIRGKLTLQMEAARWVSGPANPNRPCPASYTASPSQCVGGTLECESDFSYDWQNQGEYEWYTEYLQQFSNEKFATVYNSTGHHRPGYTKVPDIPQPMPITSSNPNVIDCSSGQCVAVGPGTAVLRPGITPTQVILGYSCPIPISNVNLSFPGFRPTWEFEVRADVEPELAKCGHFHKNVYKHNESSWPKITSTSFCSQGKLHDNYLPQPQYPDRGSSTTWKCINSQAPDYPSFDEMTEENWENLIGSDDNLDWKDVFEWVECEEGEEGGEYVLKWDKDDFEDYIDSITPEASIVTCIASREAPGQQTEAACGTYHGRLYPGFVDCSFVGEGFEGIRWADNCWTKHPSGSGTFCASGTPQPKSNPDFPFPGSHTTWYCVDGSSVSNQCHAHRDMAKPWISTQGGLVHIEGGIGLDEMKSLLYKDILHQTIVTEGNKTSLSSELLTSSSTLPQGGRLDSTGALGWEREIYTLGNYNKSTQIQINRSFYELLLIRAEALDPSRKLWSSVNQEGELDLDRCQDGNNHIYFIDLPNFEVDPAVYKNLGNGGTDGCIFIVKNNMTITEGDYVSEGMESVQYDIVRGFFLVDGVITIKKDGEDDAFAGYDLKDGLKVIGGLFATGGEQSIIIERSLGVYNLYAPTVILFHDARYLEIARKALGDVGYIRDIGFKE